MTRVTKRNGISTRRRVAVWFAAFALSLQALVPLGQAVPMPGTAGGGFLVICTSLGIQRIPDPDTPRTQDERPACPVCSAQSVGSAMLVPAPVTLAPISFGRPDAAILPSVVWSEGEAPLAPSTRGPPVA